MHGRVIVLRIFLVEVLMKIPQSFLIPFRGHNIGPVHKELIPFFFLQFKQKYILKMFHYPENALRVKLGSITFYFFPAGSLILEHMVVLIYAVDQQGHKKVGLLFLFGRGLLKSIHEHADGYFSGELSSIDVFEGVYIATHLELVVEGVRYVIWRYEHGVLKGKTSLLATFGSHGIFFLMIKLVHVVYIFYWNPKDLITFRRIKSFNEFSSFNFTYSFAVSEITEVFIFEMKVQSRIAQILFTTETFIPRGIFILLSLSTPSLLRQLFFHTSTTSITIHYIYFIQVFIDLPIFVSAIISFLFSSYFTTIVIYLFRVLVN